MRILLMPAAYAPVLGGLETAAHALARHLTAQGHEAMVLTNRYPRTLKALETIDGIQVRRKLFLRPCLADLRNRRLDLWLASLYYYPATLRYVQRLVDAFCPDVVNVHFPDAQIPFVSRLRRKRAFKLVVSLHGHEILRWFGAENGRAGDGRLAASAANRALQELRMILKGADAVTACSRYLLDKAIALEPAVAGKGHVIHNGIDLERFEDKTPFAHPRPYVLAFGRLTYKKGFDLLLRAFARVAPAHPEVDLIVAGEGEEREALRAARRDLGLEGRVLFPGRADSAEVVRLLNGCLFVVVPSRSEPFGLTALEALAAGKPVLATRVGGMPEFLGEEESLKPRGENRLPQVRGPAATSFSTPTTEAGQRTMLVEPTAAALSEGLRRWLALRAEFASHQEPDRCWPSCHTWAAVAERYLEVYNGEAGSG